MLILLGLFLRVHQLDAESLWLDEGISVRLANLPPPQIIENRASDVHPPLYFLALHYWVSLLGDSEFSVRFLSLALGLLAIPVIYRLGYLLFSKEVGVISALLLTLSTFHLYYSQEARSYNLITLLALLSMYFFVRLLKKATFTLAAGYLLSSTLLIYTHTLAMLTVGVQNIFFVTLWLFSKKNYSLSLKKWGLLQLVLAFLFAPWIGVLINQVQQVQEEYWVPERSLSDLWRTFREYSSGSFWLSQIYLVLLLLSSISLIPLSEIATGNTTRKSVFNSLKSVVKRFCSFQAKATYLLFLWLFIPVIGPFLISEILTPIYVTRITIPASLALYLLVARGIKNLHYNYLKLPVIGAILILSSLNIEAYYNEVKKEQWREVASYVDTNAEQGDVILFNAGAIQADVFDYYSKRTDLIKKPFPEETRDLSFLRTTSEDDIKMLWPTVEGHDRVWVILSHSRDRNGLIVGALEEAYHLSHYGQYKSIETYLFTATPTSFRRPESGAPDRQSGPVGPVYQ